MKLIVFGSAMVLAGCSWQPSGSYTLYRNSVLDGSMRLHVASFDSKDGDAYNSDNCRIAAELFQSQPGVTVRYWCEKGAFKA
ncbi:hypothetical protein [Rhizobium bangladeshense]|uniref:hypothetical protein n=1 Tax=Rhizobium bangladeshense TaxID=1138189 RepID=UPI001A99E6B9|nr:hypothetical protein [Rhizobium bangladeshense]MBX4931266.1 hypothetical protein [Rhizobium bangladeshense]QSY90380.1 hypothetical protein J2J98_09775 [Rhizobium bangladeshense]